MQNTPKINYQRILDETLSGIIKDGAEPSLLLHSCCAPCSSYVLEYLSNYFNITVYYYNPNIFPEAEYVRRVSEQKSLIDRQPHKNAVLLAAEEYDSAEFYNAVRGYESEPEGGARCEQCFRLRLERAAKYARRHGFDYFTTTLSISPHKNADLLNRIGGEFGEKYGIKYLFSDFKKKNGFKRSVELSEQYDLYRQDYCGCVYSKREAEQRSSAKALDTPNS